MKIEPICPNWHVLFAGDDIDHLEFLLDDARSILRKLKHSPSATEIAFAVDAAYATRLHSTIERKHLRKYGLTIDGFLKQGKKQVTETLYNRLCDKIAATKLSMKFLLVGFDAKAAAHIVEIDGEDDPRSFNPIGFSAIGTGTNSAISTLAFHADKNAFGKNSALFESIYYSCDAKFTAESASDVGRNTFLMILEHDRPPRFIFPPDIEKIRRLWRKYGYKRISMAKINDLTNLALTFDDLFQDNNYAKVFGNDKGKDAHWRQWQAIIRSRIQSGGARQ